MISNNKDTVQSHFNRDLEQEQIPIQFLQEKLFPYLAMKNDISVEYIKDLSKQYKGIDIVLNYKDYCLTRNIDVKAQMNNYIGNPTPTFCLELSYFKDNVPKTGWFLKEDLETDTYFFVWIHSADHEWENKNKILKESNQIKNMEIMCVNKQIISEYFDSIGLTHAFLEEVSEYMVEQNQKKLYYDSQMHKLIIPNETTGRYPLSFVKSSGLSECPVNLVVSKRIWSELCSAHYFVTDKEITVRKENGQLQNTKIVI